jgi:hypothetical protein
MAGDGGRVPDVSEQRAKTMAGYRCKRCGALTTDRYGQGDKCPVFPDGDAGLRDYHDLEPIRLVPDDRPVWPRYNEPAEVKRSERLSRARPQAVMDKRAAKPTGRPPMGKPRSDPASVLAALLAENPEATVSAIEALLTSETPLRAATHVMYEAPPEADVARVWDVALSAAVRSLLPKAPKEDGESDEGGNQ